MFHSCALWVVMLRILLVARQSYYTPPQVSHSGGRNRYLIVIVFIQIKYAVALRVVACPPVRQRILQ